MRLFQPARRAPLRPRLAKNRSIQRAVMEAEDREELRERARAARVRSRSASDRMQSLDVTAISREAMDQWSEARRERDQADDEYRAIMMDLLARRA